MTIRTITPVTRERLLTRRHYDRLSRWYDGLIGRFEWPFVRQGLVRLAPRAGEWLLDIGCGPGRSLAWLAPAVRPDGRVVGLDLAGGMLRASRRRLGGGPAAPWLVQADGLNPPLATGRFDGILMTFTLELFATPEIPGVLAQCRRLLRHNGRLAVAALSQAGGRRRVVALYEAGHRRWPAWLDCRPIPVASLMAAAGFNLESQETLVSWGLPVAIVLGRRGPLGLTHAAAAA